MSASSHRQRDDAPTWSPLTHRPRARLRPALAGDMESYLRAILEKSPT